MKEHKKKAVQPKTVAGFIDQQIEWLDNKTAVQIAEEAGFQRPNILSMIRKGNTKVPLARVPKLAKALEVDPIFLLDLCMREYDPENWQVIKSVLGRPVVTDNQYELLEVVRDAMPEAADFKVTPENKDKIAEFFRSL